MAGRKMPFSGRLCTLKHKTSRSCPVLSLLSNTTGLEVDDSGDEDYGPTDKKPRTARQATRVTPAARVRLSVLKAAVSACINI